MCLSGSNFLGSVCSANSGVYAAVAGPSGSSGFISQTLVTTAGQLYDLTFFLRNDNLGAPANNFFRALDDVAADLTRVPEPASLLLLGTGVAGLIRRRSRRAK